MSTNDDVGFFVNQLSKYLQICLQIIVDTSIFIQIRKFENI